MTVKEITGYLCSLINKTFKKESKNMAEEKNADKLKHARWYIKLRCVIAGIPPEELSREMLITKYPGAPVAIINNLVPEGNKKSE